MKVQMEACLILLFTLYLYVGLKYKIYCTQQRFSKYNVILVEATVTLTDMF